MAALRAEASEVRQILRHVEERLAEGGASASKIRENFNNLICLLDSPLFVQLLSIDDSLGNLDRASRHCAFNGNDFEIDPRSGELLLLTGNKSAELASHRSAIEMESPETIMPKNEAHAAMRNVSSISNKSITSISGLPPLSGTDIESITLDKPVGVGNGLGFGIVGLRSDSEELGVYVQGIQHGGVADKDGRLCENDRILAINGQLLSETSPLKEAVELLHAASGRVELIVAHGTTPITPPTTVGSSLSPTTPYSGDFNFESELIQAEVIDLFNDGSGLGFGIISGRGIGVIIKTIVTGGVSDRDGRLRSGDRILQIGSIDVRGMSTEDVAAVLRQCGVNVRLIVARPATHLPEIPNPLAPVFPVGQLDEVLAELNRKLPPVDYSTFTLSASDISETDSRQQTLASSAGTGSRAYALSPTSPPLSLPPVEVFEVVLVKDDHGLGITIAGYTNPADGTPRIFINSIVDGSVAARDGRIRVNDQIIAVDNRSLEGFNNQEAVDVLRSTGQTVCLKIARYQPGAQFEPLPRRPVSEAGVRLSNVPAVNPQAANSLYMNPGDDTLTAPSNTVGLQQLDSVHTVQYWKSVLGNDWDIIVAPIQKFKANGGLGISLQGMMTEDGSLGSRRHFIHTVLPEGPVGVSGLVLPGDELLSANDIPLHGISHDEVRTVLQDLPQNVQLVIARPPMSSPPLLREKLTNGTVFGLTTMPSNDRLVKAKSEQSLASVTIDSSSLSRGKSKSLEPLSRFGFGMWSMEPVEISLMKGEKGLGFSILDDPDTMNPGKTMIVIRSLVPGGMAQLDGRLEPGDRLVAVNGIDLFNATLTEAVDALSGAPRGVVHLAVLKPEHFGETSTDPDQIDYRQLELNGAVETVPKQLYSDNSLLSSETYSKALWTAKQDQDLADLQSSPSDTSPLPSPVKPLVRAAPVMDLSNDDDSYRRTSLTPLSISPLLVHVPPPTHSAPPPQVSKVVNTWGSPHVVRLIRKNGESLGISIVGGGHVDTSSPPSDALKALSGIFIKHIKPDSPAGLSGELKTGDHVLEVNGVDVRDATHDQAVDVIRNAASPVEFLVQSLVNPIAMSNQSQMTRSSNVQDRRSQQVAEHRYSSSEGSEDQTAWSAGQNADSEFDKIVMRYGDLDGELHIIHLKKSSTGGLGMDLAGNRHLDTMSVFVARIHPDGPVAEDGRIRVGDELLEVNEHVLYGRSHLNASGIIKSLSTNDITIVLLRREDFAEHMAVSPSYTGFTPKDDSSTLIGHVSPADYDENGDNQSEGSIHSSESVPHNDHIQSPLDVESFDNVAYFCLQKSERGFGFAIEELMVDDDRTGIFVKTITPDGPAAVEKTLSIGDRVLMVEDISLIGVTYEQALSILRNIEVGATVQLTVSKCCDDEEVDVDNGNAVVTGDAVVDTPVAMVTMENNVANNNNNNNISSSSTVSPAVSQHSSPKRKFSATPNLEIPANRPSYFPPVTSPSPTTPTAVPIIVEDPQTCAITPGKATTIEINKGKSGLGLSIVGGSDTLLGGVVVHEVYPNGAAAKDGRIMAGDQIIDVNGTSLQDVTHDRAIQVMRQAPAIIRLTVLRDDAEPASDDDIYDVLTVELIKKPNRGLGFSIVGRQDTSGIYISDIMRGGAAENDGRLLPADRIIGLNGRDVSEWSQEQVADLLKTSMGTVSITVRRLKSGSMPPPVRRRASTLSDRSGASTPGSGIPQSFSNLSNLSTASSLGEAQWSGSGGLALARHDGSTLVVELTRQERGLLKMQLAPDTSTGARSVPLVITDLFDTAGAISDKLQVFDKIATINGHSTVGMMEAEALRLIQSSPDSVIFTVVRDERSAESVPSTPSFVQSPILHDNSHSGSYSESVRRIVLRRGPKGFGFAIVGGYGSEKGDFPIIIKSVFPDGAADMDGRLKRGDQLLSVDGQSLEGATHEQAVSMLMQARDTVTLTVLS